MSASLSARIAGPIARPPTALITRSGHRTVTLTPASHRSVARRVVTCDASLDDVHPGDLLRLDFGEAEDAKETRRLIARDWLLEVTRVTNDDDHSVVHGLCRGRAFTVDAATMRMTPAPEHSQPDLASEPWVKRAYPEWYNLLQDLADEGRYPAPSASSIANALPNEGVAVDVTKLTSYDELKATVASDASFWRDGTPPNAPRMTVEQHATLNAGELLATLAGERGVAMCQLWAGWEDETDSPHDVQPVDAPFVTRALRDAALDALDAPSTVGITCTPIAGMDPAKGLTALVHSANSPFPERALHLKSFGAQAALVAGSPYYQMLVGVILGYDARHVESHVSEKGGVLTQAITAEVAKDLAALAPGSEAKIPWRPGYFPGDYGDARMTAVFGEESAEGGKRGRRGKGRKKKRSTASSVADVESMFGKRGR